jgi:type VI secretion system protein ImpE
VEGEGCNALELFSDGQLSQAIRVQDRLVREKPDDAGARLLLCELLQFAGEIPAVRLHLDKLAGGMPGMDEYVRAYRLLLDAEEKRQHLTDDGSPTFLLEPPEHISLRLKALSSLRERDFRAATDWLDEADARCGDVKGHVDGREFAQFRDTDDLFGPTLEMLVDDQCVWFPAKQLRRLRIGKIESLRDQLFVPAQLTAVGGEQWQVHLPSLYAGTNRHGDDALRTGLATDWHAEDGGPIRGIGVKTFCFGEEELSLFDFSQWE